MPKVEHDAGQRIGGDLADSGKDNDLEEEESKSDLESESNSEPESESESDSESESAPILKPVFIRKKPSKDVSPTDATPHVHIPIARKPSPLLEFAEFDGVDDTDDLDPELEFAQWQQRNECRLTRDREAQAKAETEKDDLLRRYVPHS